MLPELGLEQAIKRQDTRAFVVGAFADEDLIGICAFVPASDYGLAKTGSLIQLYVKEAFSGQKIGMRLANVLLVEAFSLADVEQVVLEVHPYNGKAVRVYEQAGFRHYEDTRVSPVGQGRLMIACKQRSEQLLSLRS